MSVENQEVDSLAASADETLDVASAAETVVEADESTADPSPAADKDEKTILSVVRDAVTTKDVADPSTAEPSDHQTAPTAPDDEDFSDAPFHKHPRFRELIQQRNDLRTPAKAYQNIEAFLTENAIEPAEASGALEWLALMKRDPEKAWEQIKPTIQNLLVTIGDVLPPDLRAQVNSGQLAPDVAKALAKERAKATIVQGQLSFRDQQAEAQRKRTEAEQVAARQTAVTTAARAWDTAVRGRDPDYAKKERRLKSEVLLLQREEGVPDTADGVKKQLDKALKAVNAEFASAAPRRPGLTPVTGGSVSGSPRAQPKSILEVVQSVGAR